MSSRADTRDESRETGSGRRAGIVDVEIGQRIKRARSERRISQEALADRLGISSQQLQKYENGANRISVSRLVEIARELQAEVTDLLTTQANDAVQIERAPDERQTGPSALELKELVLAFCEINNPDARARVLDMTKFFCSLSTSAAVPD